MWFGSLNTTVLTQPAIDRADRRIPLRTTLYIQQDITSV